MNRYERARLRRIAASCSGHTILDIGYAQMPNPYLKGFQVTGVDLQMPPTATPYGETLVLDAMELATHLAGRMFDNIVAAELIEHLERPYDFLRQTRPLLSPHGRLILSTPNPVAFPTLCFEWICSKRFYYCAEHTYYFAPRWVERMLTRSGYTLEKLVPVGLWTPCGPIPIPTSLSYQVIYVARQDS